MDNPYDLPLDIPPPSQIDARKRLIQQLHEWRAAARDIRDGHTEDHVLQLGKRFDDYDLQAEHPVPLEWPGLAPLSQIARPLPDGFSVAQTAVHLITPIQSATSAPSQVWTASFRHGRSEENANLAVKIYQSSFYPGVRNGDFEDFITANRIWRRFHHPHNEARAYAKFKNLQGSLVPRVYGFFLVRVKLQHGEPAIAVRGTIKPPIQQTALGSLDQPVRRLFAVSCAMYDCGTISADVREENIIWPALQSNAIPMPVFLHFGSAVDASKEEIVHQFPNNLHVMRDYGFPNTLVNKWVDDNLDHGDEIPRSLGLAEQDITGLRARARFYDPV